MSAELKPQAGAAPTVPLFHADWFSRHIPLWEYLLEFYLPKRDKFLEVGSFEGYSACWMLQHALSPEGTLYCVDTWLGSPEFAEFPPEVILQAFDTFQRNIAMSKGSRQQVIALKNASVDALAGLIHLEHATTFDLIYIDGGHEAIDALRDALMAWPLLKSGGLMIFDDYTWEMQRELGRRPKVGIDAFTSIYNEQLRTLSVGLQYAVQKI